ncbi:mCG1030184 [Mus musculus]|nr:mCG1030184 [Mus musculus]
MGLGGWEVGVEGWLVCRGWLTPTSLISSLTFFGHTGFPP